ncbi:hypothetical protein PHYBOEH_007432 [Phytophthora boehmeriae]|uniref:RxLR effector protein n=1 Tax=Phytophthora boehmeriae TaxID=109152 RepID=A0A8T1WCX7_9STRA|nr:hypothetical protein PHYBOEH_007432 [Phytophthora boehmeriae]
MRSARLVLLVLWTLFAAVSAAAAASDLKLQLDADQPVTVKLADGTERELSAAEFEQLAKDKAKERSKLQSEDSTEASEARWQRQRVEEIEAKDPQFALHIDLARRAFAELQRHGYARGYALSGFSELDANAMPAQQKEDYYVELILRARRDPKSGVSASTGTGTRKTKTKDETPLSYEVQLLLDVKKRFSVVAAWELSETEPPRGRKHQRVLKLSIQPSAALLEREAKRDQGKMGGRPKMATWLLAGGVGLVAAGVLVMYHTRNPVPTPRPRRRSSEVWELVDENDQPIKAETEKDKKTK